MVALFARHRALLVGLTAQVLQYGSALALVPFMVTRLSAAEVGIWYVFMGVQTLAFVCDFGFQPSFTRAFALAHAGEASLRVRGLGTEPTEHRPPNLVLLAEVRWAARLFYRLLAGAILLLLLAFGLPYISWLAADGGVDLATARIAWAIFALSVAFNLSLQWIGPALMGGGKVESNYLFVIANRGGFAVFGIVTLLAGGGLISLAIALVLAQALGRLWAVWLLRGVACGDASVVTRASAHQVLRTIWPNASKMGVVAIGGFLINRYSLFAISFFGGLAAAGSYALSLQMLTAVAAVAQLPMQVAMPKLVALRVARDRAALKRTYVSATLLYFTLGILGALAVVLVVPVGLSFIGSRVTLLPTAVLALLAIVVLLEGSHANAAFFITTGNEVPFVRAAVLSGIGVAATTTLAGWLGGDVTVLIACQGLVQLAYNNWRWPLLAWREVTHA